MSGYYSLESPSARQVAGAAGERVKYGGLYLPAKQSMHLPANSRHEIMIIPSTSAPSFSGQFVCDLKTRGVVVHQVGLQFGLSSVSGLTGGTPANNPIWFAPTRIDVLASGSVVQTLYPTGQFLLAQLLNTEEERKFLNTCAGDYSSTTQRNALTTATSTYFMPLHCFINQINPVILTENHALQFRVYMDSLSNFISVGGATGSASVSINFCNLIARVTYLPPDIQNYRLTEMAKIPYTSLAHECRMGAFSVAAGVSSANLVLTPLTGNLNALLFVVRPVASLTGTGAFSFTQISSFNILDSAGASLCGGQPINHSLAVWLASKHTRSTYATENSLSTTNNNANVYLWAFSGDFSNSMKDGLAVTSRRFVGSEVLVVNFASTLSAGVEVLVYGYNEVMIQQTPAGFNKVSN